MRNPRLATRYAKALMDLAIEQNQLEEVNSSVNALEAACSDSRELTLLIKSPIIKADKKIKVLKAVIEKLGTDKMTEGFVNLICTKHREYFLTEIFSAFKEQYKIHKKIASVKLTVAHELSDEMKSKIESTVKSQLEGHDLDIEIAMKPEILGGFILEANNKQFDASILRDLKDVKDQFLKNIYIHNIR